MADQDIQIHTTEEPVNLVVNANDEIVVVGANIGLQGPPGPAGPTGTTYTHNQITPNTQWTINHSLNKYPSVTIIDSGGTTVVGNIHYQSINQIIVEFEAPFGGKAFLN